MMSRSCNCAYCCDLQKSRIRGHCEPSKTVFFAFVARTFIGWHSAGKDLKRRRASVTFDWRYFAPPCKCRTLASISRGSHGALL